MPLSHQSDNQQASKILYLDGTKLLRPLDPPSSVRRGMLLFALIACLIGGVVLAFYLNTVVSEPQRQQEALQENISRDVALDLPLLTTLMPLEDQVIMDTLASSGYTLYEKSPIGSFEKGGFEVIKLPTDVSLEQAGLMYLEGIDNLDPADAGLLLHGSWSFSIDRSAGVNMRVRYADFGSGTVDAAIQNAKAAEGLAELQAEEAGVDDSGNTFQAGTVEMNGEVYSWRVSVIPLVDVYAVEGLPDTAYYVGIRFMK